MSPVESFLAGEKFEGGYHIERNPITGAARLVHPPSPSKGECSFVPGFLDFVSHSKSFKAILKGIFVLVFD